VSVLEFSQIKEVIDGEMSKTLEQLEQLVDHPMEAEVSMRIREICAQRKTLRTLKFIFEQKTRKGDEEENG
jgi:hypothetical protein